jgi:hypothetical protein
VSESISFALAVDTAVVTLTAAFALRFVRCGFSHPLTPYFVFHLVVVTFRLISLYLGSDTLFAAGVPIYEPVSDAEIVRASLIADLGLVTFTVACARAYRRERRARTMVQRYRRLELRHIQSVAIIAFPIGVIGLLLASTVPGISIEAPNLGDWQASGWIVVTATWTGLALLGLIYWYGFRWVLLIPIGAYTLLMMYQGFHRFRVIIPLLLMCQMYLDRHRRRWPTPAISAALLLLVLIFFPLKSIGRMAQLGYGLDDIAQESTMIVRNAFASDGEMQLLDEFASGVTLMDDAARRDYGTGYLALLTLPIPRQWWPSKPGLADYLADISTKRRPMAEAGMVVSYLGEAYLNFGYAGVLVLPWFSGYALSRAYYLSYRQPYFSVARFGYLLVASNLIQVFRDGLTSLVVFTFVHMMPLTVIVALHYVIPARPAVLRCGMQPSSPIGSRPASRAVTA